MTAADLAAYRKRASENWPTSHDVHDLCDAVESCRAEIERLQREVKHLTSSEKKAAAVSMQAQAEVWSLRRLIRELTDPDPCDFDHKGGCQAHGYLTLKPGQTCPQYDAQQIVKKYEAAL